MSTISNTDNVIDSRDVIARIKELYDELLDYYSDYELNCEVECDDVDTFEDWLDLEDCYRDEKDEYIALTKLAKQGEDSPDWSYGERIAFIAACLCNNSRIDTYEFTVCIDQSATRIARIDGSVGLDKRLDRLHIFF